MSLIWIFVLFVFFWLASVYQRMATNQEHVEKAWALLDHELKARAHLVPNLIGAVERYTLDQDEFTQPLSNLKKLLNEKMSITQREHVESEMTRQLHRLFLKIKAEPKLDHDELIETLLKKFDVVDEDLFLTRQIYNSAVLRAKAVINSFPGSYLAAFFNFPQPPFFDHPINNVDIFNRGNFPKS